MSRMCNFVAQINTKILASAPYYQRRILPLFFVNVPHSRCRMLHYIGWSLNGCIFDGRANNETSVIRENHAVMHAITRAQLKVTAFSEFVCYRFNDGTTPRVRTRTL